MPIYSLGKARESLTFSSENYKSLVRKYLESMGYSQITDSYVEGHLSDMIFVNPDISIYKYFYVECKATTLSVHDKKFCSELLEYLTEWLNLPECSRFELYIFVMKLRNKKEFEKIFGSQFSEKNLKQWIDKYIWSLTKERREIIENEDFKTISSFFLQIKIFEADIEQLKFAIEEKSRISDLSLKRYAQNLLTETQRRTLPTRKKNKLLSNLIKFIPPNLFYIAKSKKFKKKEEIYNYFNESGLEIPPFLFDPRKQQMSTFCPFDNSNSLVEIIEGKPSKINFYDKNVSVQFKISLINQHLRRILWKKGLRRISGTNIYFFECFEKDGVFQDRCRPNASGQQKVVSHPYYKEDENGNKKLNFIFHHAVEISPKFIWGGYYIQIIPKRVYTLDGFTPIAGKSKDIIDRKFRNPVFNRSSNKLSEIKFWIYYLFECNEYEKTPEKWFEKFRFGEMLTFDFDWSPETIGKGQTLLDEFQNGVYTKTTQKGQKLFGGLSK